MLSLIYSGSAGYTQTAGKPKPPTPAQQGQRLYEQKCSQCHQPKPLNARTPKQWMTLIYSSGCPDVTIKLSAQERDLLKHYIQDATKPKPPDKK